jgi:hypothetical protein
MRALSVRQPWAWAIIHAGKNIENRTWTTKHRGPLAIHASQGCTRAEYDAASVEIERITGKRPPTLAELPRGCVVGTVDMVDCVEEGETENPWAQDDCCWWMLSSPCACEPLATRGRLGLFEIAAELRFRDVTVVALAPESLS